MSNDPVRRARFLEALARLHPSWVHESRSQLGSVSLQLDLMLELLGTAGEAGLDPARFRVCVERARSGVGRLERGLDLHLGAARPRPSHDPPGLGVMLEEVVALVTPAARERTVAWPPAPQGAMPTPRDTEAVREWLLIAAVGSIFTAPEGSAVELRCESNGTRGRMTVTVPGESEPSERPPGPPVGPDDELMLLERAEGDRHEWILEFAIAESRT